MRPQKDYTEFTLSHLETPRPECEECGERVRPGTRCWETGMQH